MSNEKKSVVASVRELVGNTVNDYVLLCILELDERLTALEEKTRLGAHLMKAIGVHLKRLDDMAPKVANELESNEEKEKE